jgi:RNA polymerase sigma factor (sigma-70 family)
MHDHATPLQRFVHQLAAAGELGRLTDGQLLTRFVQQRDEAAFEVLVHRHGALVWRVCRQVLPNAQDREDAFQATFLVLVRKAGSIARPELLGPWLHGVASRVAGRVRGKVLRRTGREHSGVEGLDQISRGPMDEPDLASDLHEELCRLPAKYRQPLVVCYLEGWTNEEAARQLGCPPGTLKIRLLRGREMLRTRLARRGQVVPMATLVAALSPGASEALAAPLADAAIKAGLVFSTCKSTASAALSPRVLALTTGVLQTMWWTKVTTIAAVVFTLGLIGGAGWLSFRTMAAQPEPSAPIPMVQSTPQEAKPREIAEPSQRPPEPGGDGIITRARFTRACMPGNGHTWYFKGKRFLLIGDKGAIPENLVQALLGDNRKAARIAGEWDLDSTQTVLVFTGLTADGKPAAAVVPAQQVMVFTGLTADGKPAAKEARLAVSPAGLLRINMEKAEQYNVLSFEDKLPPPQPGVTFPIYEYAHQIDLAFLQGTWLLKEHVVDGKPLAVRSLERSKVQITGKTLTLVLDGATSKGTINLDAALTPPILDVTFTDGPEKGRTWLGIYELREETLRLCSTRTGKDRPGEFISKAGSGHIFTSTVRQNGPGE